MKEYVVSLTDVEAFGLLVWSQDGEGLDVSFGKSVDAVIEKLIESVATNCPQAITDLVFPEDEEGVNG